MVDYQIGMLILGSLALELIAMLHPVEKRGMSSIVRMASLVVVLYAVLIVVSRP